MSNQNVKAWHEYIKNPEQAALLPQLDDDVVFHSPVVHTPQAGKQITCAYLTAATQVFANSGFVYLKEIVDGNRAVLEFQCEVEGTMINGVDIITWNEAGLITEFKVMVRPLKAMNKIHEKMAQMLEKLRS